MIVIIIDDDDHNDYMNPTINELINYEYEHVLISSS